MVLRILLLELDWSIIKENILQIHSSLLRIYKKYEIDTVTGHSLGGRDAIFLGLRYNIKNVVAYNPAPLEVKSIRNKLGGQLFRNTTFPDEKYLKELMDNYDGDITKVITQKDGLDYLVKHTDHLTCGDVLRINNGQGHAMENFRRKRTT